MIEKYFSDFPTKEVAFCNWLSYKKMLYYCDLAKSSAN